MKWVASSFATDFTDAFPALCRYRPLCSYLHLSSSTRCYFIHSWGCQLTRRSPWNYCWYLLHSLVAVWLQQLNEWDTALFQVHIPEPTSSHLPSCNSSFQERDGAESQKLLHASVCSAVCKPASCVTQPQLLSRRKIQAFTGFSLAAAQVLSPKWEDALGYRYTFCQPDVKRHLRNWCWPPYLPIAPSHTRTLSTASYWNDDRSSLPNLELKTTEDGAGGLFMDGSIALIERCKRFPLISWYSREKAEKPSVFKAQLLKPRSVCVASPAACATQPDADNTSLFGFDSPSLLARTTTSLEETALGNTDRTSARTAPRKPADLDTARHPAKLRHQVPGAAAWAQHCRGFGFPRHAAPTALTGTWRCSSRGNPEPRSRSRDSYCRSQRLAFEKVLEQ